MQHQSNTFRRVGLAGFVLAGLMMTGCETMGLFNANGRRTVVTPRVDAGANTVVRVYNLKAIGLQDATEVEIEAFTGMIRDMVVAKDWNKTRSDVQVFGAMMTVKATLGNHLLIEDYMTRIEKVMTTS